MNDEQRFTAMRGIIDALEQLPLRALAEFVDLAMATSHERAAAERALTRWQVESTWTSQRCSHVFPRAASLLEHCLETARPAGLPYVARTAAIDAVRCTLLSGLTPALPESLRVILCGPVDDVLDVAEWCS